MTKSQVYEFEASIKPADRGGTYVAFPYDIREEFGKGRVKVHATFDGEPYDGSIVNGKKLKLYIVSAKEPSVDILAQELHIDKDRDYATSPYEPFLSQLEREQQWAFRLQANPTKSIKTEGYSTRGKRVGILKPEDQIEWLWKQARKFGFHMPINRVELPEVMVREAESVDFARQGSTVTLMRVVFDGILAVDDPELLRTALTEGIGRAKGYGNGLLTLVPLVGERSRG